MKGLPSQDIINEAKSQNTRSRVLEQTDGMEESVVKWEFKVLLDCWKHPKNGLQYLVKWKHHKPSW